jgi:hypothetical protein
MVLLSPHYPWVYAWIVAFACLVPWLSPLWLTLASLLLYIIPVRAHIVVDSHRLAVETAIYPPLAALDLERSRGSALLRPSGRRMKNNAQ